MRQPGIAGLVAVGDIECFITEVCKMPESSNRGTFVMAICEWKYCYVLSLAIGLDVALQSRARLHPILILDSENTWLPVMAGY